MGCPFDPPRCLAEHIRPALKHWTDRPDSTWYGAACPAHNDHKNSFSIRAGTHDRITYRCYKNCTRADIRTALIRAGVPAGCLPPIRRRTKTRLATEPAAPDPDITTTIGKILESGRPHPERLLEIAVLLWHSGQVPAGLELQVLADRVGISRATAYRHAAQLTHYVGSPTLQG